MTESKSLRELFREDFGIDLPVSGWGGGPDSPFTIVVENAQHAVNVQTAVLHCLARGQQVAWRFLSQEVTDSAPVRTRIRIQTVELTADQIFTEARRYYFVWGGPAANDPVQILPLPSGFTDARSGISLPYELGWLHFDGATDGEAENPGLGVTIAYVGAWAKGTIFLYDKRQHVDSTDQGRLEAEFRAAIEVALKAMPGSSVKALGPISDDSEQSEWRLALLESPKNTMSAVLLAAAKGFFVKGRIDWQASDKQTDKMGLACVGAAMKIVS